VRATAFAAPEYTRRRDAKDSENWGEQCGLLRLLRPNTLADATRKIAKIGESSAGYCVCCARIRWIREAIRSISSLQWSFNFFNFISSRRSSEFR